MAGYEEVEEHDVERNQGDADGHVGRNREPGQVHAYMFNQISLNSQDPDVVVRSASTQRLPPSVVRWRDAPVPANVHPEFASTKSSYWLKKGSWWNLQRRPPSLGVYTPLRPGPY